MFSLFSTQSFYVQSDFEGCADILTCDRPQQNVTIEPMMPYTNVDIFQEKGAKSFSKKSLAATEFYGKINHSRLFLLSFNSKLSHFDKNLNLNLNFLFDTFLTSFAYTLSTDYEFVSVVLL
jgi:hypothetical protein